MKIKFRQWECDLVKLHYHNENGNIALKLVEAVEPYEPIATCTVWLEGLAKDEIAIKDYSENEGMYDVLLKNEVITPAHRYASSGWIVNGIPVCYLKADLDEKV